MSIRFRELLFYFLGYIYYLCDSVKTNEQNHVKNKTYLIGLVCAVACMLFLLSAKEVKTEAKQQNSETIHFSTLQNLTFAGEKVPTEYFDVQESLERELISNTYFHSQTIFLLKRTDRYFSVIEPILKSYGIPEDFKYLAVAESILRDKAKSPVGAAGIWQLMKATAQGYGIEVNSNVDERYNLLISTHAACKYLLESYEKYENWTLVAASYNIGRYGLDRSMAYQKEDDYYNMYLNSETARYVYRILAFKLIIESPEKYGFDISEEEMYPVFEFDTITVDYPIEHLADFAKEHGMNYKTLKIFNPWFLENKLNNKSKKTYEILKAKSGYREL